MHWKWIELETNPLLIFVAKVQRHLPSQRPVRSTAHLAWSCAVRGPSINTAAPAASGVSIGQDGRSVEHGPLLLPRVDPPSGPADGVQLRCPARWQGEAAAHRGAGRFAVPEAARYRESERGAARPGRRRWGNVIRAYAPGRTVAAGASAQ